jgi:hypothetical protein
LLVAAFRLLTTYLPEGMRDPVANDDPRERVGCYERQQHLPRQPQEAPPQRLRPYLECAERRGPGGTDSLAGEPAGPIDARPKCQCLCSTAGGCQRRPRTGNLWTCTAACSCSVCEDCLANWYPVICHWCYNYSNDPDTAQGRVADEITGKALSEWRHHDATMGAITDVWAAKPRTANCDWCGWERLVRVCAGCAMQMCDPCSMQGRRLGRDCQCEDIHELNESLAPVSTSSSSIRRSTTRISSPRV